ncbi:MAG TPA: hypothetical protein VF916_16205 [Ktedonobacterales bacterium]
MSYNWDWGDPSSSSTMDMSGSAIDAGTLGDVPQDFGSGVSIPDYGPIASYVQNLGGSGGGMVPAMAMGGAVMAGAGMAARMSAQAINAIVKLSQRLGGASGSVVGYGRKIWGSLSAWAAKNPGVSLMATLTSLGLTVEEAAHFIAWGATTKRRRRTRGINGRDIKTTRRTLRKLRSLNHLMATACSSFRGHTRRHK